MNGEKSFREIFFEQMGQKSASSEVKTSFFDPTLNEITPPSLPRFQFFSRQNQRSYNSNTTKNSGFDAKKRTAPSSPTQPKTTAASTVAPRPERRLESHQAFSPQQKASLQVIEDHLGKGPLLPITESAFKRLYRFTMKKCHPDQGGDARTFVRVRQAFKELERAFPPRSAE